MTNNTRRVFPLGFILRFSALVFIYTVTRLLFYFFNHAAYESFAGEDVLRAFGLGLRFDLWIITATLLPLFLFELWSWKSQMRAAHLCTRIFSGFVFSLHAIFIFLELSDTQYFRFTGRRTTLAILNLSSDSIDQSLQLLINFWVVPVLSLVLIALLALVWRATRTLAKTPAAAISFRRLLIVLLAGIALGVLGLRSGFQTKPLSPAHAMLLGHPQLAALALSTSFQMSRSSENRHLKPQSFFSDEQQVRRILELPRDRHAPVKLENYNVVVLVVESLSMEYMGLAGITKNYVPFITQLANKSLFFENAYANGRTSIEALPSVLASIPSMVGEPFITSQYSSVKTLSLGHELDARGYSSAFFHGAKNGSMFIDSIAQLFGFSKFFGKFEYPSGTEDFDGHWGIFDEPFLQFATERIGELKPPFVSGIFTLSSHNPYKIPPQHRQRFSEYKRPFLNSLAYADYAIEQFFATAEKQSWFKNTLFIITGDHTTDPDSQKFRSEQAEYRVPILFYVPSGQLKPAVSKRIVQHADIFPSVLDLLGIDQKSMAKPMSPLGQSVFLPDHYGRAGNRAGDWFWYQEGNLVVRFPADGTAFTGISSSNTAHASGSELKIEIVQLDEDSITPSSGRSPTESEMQGIVQRAKAYLQFYNNRLIRNQLLEP
jgi:uncharacterized sulfatase